MATCNEKSNTAYGYMSYCGDNAVSICAVSIRVTSERISYSKCRKYEKYGRLLW